MSNDEPKPAPPAQAPAQPATPPPLEIIILPDTNPNRRWRESIKELIIPLPEP
jgi:hypothetical protein